MTSDPMILRVKTLNIRVVHNSLGFLKYQRLLAARVGFYKMRYFCWWFCATQLNNTRKSIWIISPENRSKNKAASFLFPEWCFLFRGCFFFPEWCFLFAGGFLVPGRVFSVPGMFSVPFSWGPGLCVTRKWCGA